MNSKLTLYYRPGACALAPHIVLNWIGHDYDAVSAPRGDSYKEINPTGAVPALQFLDGGVLTQAGAILQYLAEAFDRADLLGGREPRNHAEVLKWISFFTGDFHPAFFPVFVPQRYTTHKDEESRLAAMDAGILLVQNGLNIIEQQLSGKDWFVGSNKTIVDTYAVPMLRWANLRLNGGLEGWPVAATFYRMICKDDGVIAAMKTHGIQPD